MRSTLHVLVPPAAERIERTIRLLRGEPVWSPSHLALADELRRGEEWRSHLQGEPRTWERFCAEALLVDAANLDRLLAARAEALRHAGHVCVLCAECRRCRLCARPAEELEARGWPYDTGGEIAHAECRDAALARHEEHTLSDAREKLVSYVEEKGFVSAARMPKAFFQYVASATMFQRALESLVRGGVLRAERRRRRIVYVLARRAVGA